MQLHRKKTIRKQTPLNTGICFEPLEPRLLLSGTWGAGADNPFSEDQATADTSFSQDTVVTRAKVEATPAAAASGAVDLLGEAPVLSLFGSTVPESNQATPADAVAATTETVETTAVAGVNDASSTADSQSDDADQQYRHELLLINDNVTDYEQLVADIMGDDSGRSIEVVVLDSQRDGIEQVSQILAERSDLAAVHLITHGAEARISLGNGWLTADTLEANQAAVAAWGDALTESGDMLFYGCNLAGNSAGQALLGTFSNLTGADAAASTDITGHASLGGDWDLEHVSGYVEAEVAIQSDVQNEWVYLLAAPTDLSSGIELNNDGGNDAYLISDTGLSQSLTSTTVEIRFAANDTPYEPVFISFNNPTGDELSIQIDEPSKNLELDFGAGTIAYASTIDYRAALVDGSVHTLSVTWDSIAGDWAVYIDGAFIESGTGLSAVTSLDMINGRFVFGQEQDGLNSGYDSNQYFSGTFYDVRIWNDVRTAGEIAQYYQQQLDLTPAAAATVGLVANWQMNGLDGSNQIVDSVSGNNLSISHASGTGFTAGAVDSRLSVDEGSANGTHVGYVTTADPDPGETFSYSLSDSAGGRFAIDSVTGEITVANGVLLDYETAASHDITVRVEDSGGLSYSEVLTIQVNDVNYFAPVLAGANNFAAINEDDGTNAGTQVSDLIAGQFSDAEPGALSGIAVIAVDDTNGTWQYTTDGGTNWTAFGAVDASTARLLAADANTSVHFVPDADWNGTVTDGITFHAWDRASGTAGGTADLTSSTYTVRDEFNADAFTGNEGPVNWTGNWIETDTMAGGATIGYVQVTAGELVLNGTGINSDNIAAARSADLSSATSAALSFDFRTDIGVDATDSVIVEVSDNGGATWTTLETITGITGATAASRSYDISAYATATTQVRFRIANNYADLSEFFYVDNAQIEYSTGGGTGGTTAFSAATAGSSITVNPANDAGTFGGATSGSGTEDAGDITGTLTFTDAADGATAPNFTVTGAAGNGTATIIAGTGAWTYTPAANFNGTDSFSVSVTDDDGNTETQVISITVNPVDDPVTIGGDTSGSGNEDGGAITGTLTATDAADGLTDGTYFTVTTDGANGSAGIDAASGAWTYTPNADFNGSDSFTVTITDDDGHTATQVVNITVNPANDAPTLANAIPDQAATEVVAFSFSFAANTFSDVDAGDSLTYTASGLPGWLSFDAATRTFSGTPANGDVGTVTITVRATDGSAAFVEDQFDVTVANANNAATIVGANTGAVTKNIDTDADGPDGDGDPIEPDLEPEPELPPDEILPPVEAAVPPPEDPEMAMFGPSTPMAIMPTILVSPAHYIPSITQQVSNHLFVEENGSAAGISSAINYLKHTLAMKDTTIPSPNLSALFSSEALSLTLDRIQQQLDLSLALDVERDHIVIGVATGLGVSVFAGYVIWAFRGASLLVGALSAMPMWRCFDPLPVLMVDDKEDGDAAGDARGRAESETDEDELKRVLETGQTDEDRQESRRRQS